MFYFIYFAGIWSIDETAFIKLPCLYESTHYRPLDGQTVSPNPAWVVLRSGQDINVESLHGVKFIFKGENLIYLKGYPHL